MSVMVGSITIHIHVVIISKKAHVNVGMTPTDIEQLRIVASFYILLIVAIFQHDIAYSSQYKTEQ